MGLEALNDTEGVGETVQMIDSSVIPTKRSRKVQIEIDDYIYALRNRIERCINALENSRRLATVYARQPPAILPSSRSHLSDCGRGYVATGLAASGPTILLD